MKQTEVTVRFLEPEDGKVLRLKEDVTIISKKVALSVNDSADNWEEVDELTATAEKILAEEELLKENL